MSCYNTLESIALIHLLHPTGNIIFFTSISRPLAHSYTYTYYVDKKIKECISVHFLTLSIFLAYIARELITVCESPGKGSLPSLMPVETETLPFGNTLKIRRVKGCAWSRKEIKYEHMKSPNCLFSSQPRTFFLLSPEWKSTSHPHPRRAHK